MNSVIFCFFGAMIFQTFLQRSMRNHSWFSIKMGDLRSLASHIFSIH